MKTQRIWIIRRLVLFTLSLVLGVFVSTEVKTASVTHIPLTEQGGPWSVQQRVLVLTVPLSLALGLSLLKRRHVQKVKAQKSRED